MKTTRLLSLLGAVSLLAPLHLGAAQQIKHVFVIVLENEGYNTTFGPGSQAPYLSQTLPSKGVLLPNYYGTAHVSLGNYIAMISGQAATNETRTDCQVYQEFHQTATAANGQAVGSGCVYPPNVLTVADQLDNAAKTWKAYMEEMGNDPNREANACGHPPINTTDGTQSAESPVPVCLRATSTPRATTPLCTSIPSSTPRRATPKSFAWNNCRRTWRPRQRRPISSSSRRTSATTVMTAPA